MGSYSWVVCLRTLHRTIIAARGGGRICISENDNLNAKITSARVEALGMLAGMHFAQKWKGRVEWKIDNTSVISTHAKRSWLPARKCMQQSNRGVWLDRTSWTGHKSGSGFSDLAPSILHYNWF
jgi:hypothetical protein